jgi:hypothetical protein
MKRLAIIATGLLLSAGGAAAEDHFETGNQLLTTCTNPQSSALCNGYIAGVTGTINTLRFLKLERDCTPSGATFGQTRDVIVRYLQHNPETRHLNAALLVITAIEEAWCPEPSPKTDTPSTSYK